MARRSASAGAARLRTIPDVQPYIALPGFVERAPGVWTPEDYKPNRWEFPTPVVDTPERMAEEYVRCAQRLDYFIFSACWSLHTDDPSADPVYRKFPAYPHLIRFFRTVQRPENVLVEKSRQMLMSWAWMGVFLWDILFHQSWSNLAISDTEPKVDDGAWMSTPQSLFGKLRVLWSSLPPHLQHPIEMTHLMVRCPETNSYIKGISGQTSGGRGGAFKRALIDEAAHIKRGEQLFASVKEAAKTGLALNSTPLGKGNVFSRLRFQKDTQFRRVTLHWTEHPEKARGLYCTCGWQSTDKTGRTNMAQFDAHVCLPRDATFEKVARAPRSPWYDHATADYTPEQVASEFDLSYELSQRGRVFDAFDARIHVRDIQQVPITLSKKVLLGAIRENETPLSYRKRYLRGVLDPDLVTVCGWDFGIGDPTVLVLGQIVDESAQEIRWIDEYHNTNEDWEHYYKFVMGLWQPMVREITKQDILHYGDPAGKARAADLMSWVKHLRNFSDERQQIVIIHGPKVGTKIEWIDHIRTIIRKNHIEVMSQCAYLADACAQYHFPLDADGNPVPGAHEPVHDKWSHPADALRYVYQFRWPYLLGGKNVVSADSFFAPDPREKREKAPAMF